MNNLLEKYKEIFPTQITAICNAVKNKKLGHAYMIYSDDPIIRKEFSILLAQLTACPTPSDDGLACGHCSVCRQLENESYAELFSLMPVSKSRQIIIGDDKHTPDSMHWFQAKFFMSSVSLGLKKIGIISDADCLNKQSQNAFLKTLEEPPRNCFFILNTGNPSALLPTIISRCHIISLLKNSCQYEFKGHEDLVYALMRLQNCNDINLTVSEECALVMIKISQQLQAEAEKNTLPIWKKRLDDIANPNLQLTPAMKKRIKLRFEAACSSEYLKLRSSFLSLIHTWFAQAYQLSCGAKLENLSNPDIYQHLDINNSILTEERAYKGLIKSEKLLQNLNWNIKEELAIKDFCCSFHL